MKHATRTLAVLVLLLVVSGCQKNKLAQSHQVVITSTGSTCTATPDKVQVKRGHKVKWDLGPGTSGDFDVTFKQKQPCEEGPPWKAGGSKVCSIATNAAYHIYDYNISKNGTLCADPSVQVCNGNC